MQEIGSGDLTLLHIIPHQTGPEGLDISQEEAGGRRRTSLAECVPLYGEWVCRMRQGMERLERKLAGKAFDNPTVTGQDWSCSSLSLATEA